jgi:5-methyltetrahydropteroyltriglutamate--homocysteine methyltransferase
VREAALLEARQELIARIHEASRYVPLERLAVSPQCGFAFSILGNRLSVDAEKRKLQLLTETAREVWS